MELATLVDALPDAVIVVDGAGDLTWGNRASARLFGRTLEDSIGLSALEFVHPDDVGIALAALSSVVDKDVGTPLELRVRAADGWHLVELVGTPLGDKILMVMRDLTERRRWELAGDHMERFRVILQNAAPPTLLLDAHGTVMSSSATLTRVFGIDQEWLEGRSLSDLVEHADRSDIDSALTSLLEVTPGTGHGIRRELDVSLIKADGTPTAVMLELANLLDDPTVEGIVATLHDVSRRARAEDEVREANSLLATTLDATTDGVLAVDLEGRIASYNRRFIEMWGVPPHVLQVGTAQGLTEFVLESVVDPDGFMRRALALYKDRNAESHDVIEFVDGRVFERDSRPQRLGDETIGRVWSFRDVTNTRTLQAELERQATHDSLTGLANQMLFRRSVDEAAQAASTAHGPNTHGPNTRERDPRHPDAQEELAVLFVDIDGFKNVNDSLGHSAGNEMLVTVATRLSECVRTRDTVARLGGDEFAVLVERFGDNTDVEDIALRILASLSAPITLAERPMTMSASIGIAYGSSGEHADDLLRNADLAMYVAKKDGRDRFRTFVPEMHDEALRRLEVDSRLRGAAMRGELVVHYQPVVETYSGAIIALEALVRWSHPEQGLLFPLDFIPLAEQSDLINEIGEHVLGVACDQARAWGDLVGADWAPAISVNLAPRQLLNDGLPAILASHLDRTGIKPSRLIMEVTESALMQDPIVAAARLERLKSLGVRLALDDFGTGHSSLAHLQRFPIDTLKIDRQFVEEVEKPTGSSLVGAITQLAHTLGMNVVAEGVETEEQRYALEMLGCDLAQGYLFARPLTPEAATEMLRGARTASIG